MIGCSKSDNNEECGPGLGYYSTISEAFLKVNDAAVPYSQDPSPGNCEVYKSALKTYANVLEKNKKCANEAGESENWKKDMQLTQKTIDQLQC